MQRDAFSRHPCTIQTERIHVPRTLHKKRKKSIITHLREIRLGGNAHLEHIPLGIDRLVQNQLGLVLKDLVLNVIELRGEARLPVRLHRHVEHRVGRHSHHGGDEVRVDGMCVYFTPYVVNA